MMNICYAESDNNTTSSLSVNTNNTSTQNTMTSANSADNYAKLTTNGLTKLPKLDSDYIDSQISKYSSRKAYYSKLLSSTSKLIKKTRNKYRLKKLRNRYYYYQSQYNAASSSLGYHMNLRNSEWYVPKAVRAYLKKTSNCQVDNSQIASQALILCEQGTYETAENIFNWVRDNCEYSFYYNTKYGAVQMLNTKNGNCIDHSHLIVALARTAGIPARYAHAQCQFSTMTVGHVWAELYIKGKWYTADATSYRNTFGTQNNCKILYMKGRYLQLPF